MRFVYSIVMLACAVIAFYHTSRIFHNKTYKQLSWCLFTMLSFASGVWSLGYGVMFFTDDERMFSIFRIVGFAGIILMMIAGQVIIGTISERIRKTYILIIFETVLGIAVLFEIGKPGSYTMEHTVNGIVTVFTSNTLSIIYTAYVIAIAIVTVVVTADLASKKFPHRIRAIGKALLKLEGLIGIGMIFDTILPAAGINFNIPASTILQFGGLTIFNGAILTYNRNNIDMANMASYIYSALKVPVLVFAPDHTLQIANQEARVFFRLSDDIITGKRPGEFWKEAFGKDTKELSFGEHISESFEEVDLVQNRKLKISVDSIYDRYDDYLGYIVVVNDMTRENEYMDQLTNAREDALKAKQVAEEEREAAKNANKAKSLFLANMSHEMRTPMNAIIGFSDMALRRGKEMGITDEIKEYFDNISVSAKGLLSVLNSILNISKIESGKMELVEGPYAPADIFKEIRAVFSVLANQKNIDFRINVPENFPERLYGDSEKVKEIIYNLTNNAIKYTNHGSVTINAEVTDYIGDRACIRISVEDTGMGIKPEDIDKIFESFKRVDMELNKKTEGTGLGLSIVKGYIDLMDGKISAESIYGRGSVFTVFIEQKIESMAVLVPHKKSQLEKSGRRKLLLKNIRILAVDDIMMNLKVVTEICKLYGVSCDYALSGKESIEKAKEIAYDIILMDQMMPEMDGIEAMQRIRMLKNGYEQGGKHKIIALTANTMQGVKEEMLELGFDGYLGKPVALDELEELLETYLEESQLVYEFSFSDNNQ